MSTGPTRKRLPVRPSIEHLRKQAKRLARVQGRHLTEVQSHLAHDYGFPTWEALAAHVAALADRSESWRTTHDDNLPKATNAGDLDGVRALLEAGAFTQHDLDLALGRAALRFGERRAIAELLVEHGADPDGQYGADYGPIVFVTGEALDPDGLQFLIDQGADVTFAPVATKYGFQCPLSYVLGTYLRGHNAAKHRAIAILLAHGAFVPSEVTPPVLAIHRGEVDALARYLDDEPALVHRRIADLPYGNLPLATGTLLHCAVELGELGCVDVLLERGADLNGRADRPHGPTPIFHAIGGNRAALEHLRRHHARRVDLTIRASCPDLERLVTPLEYAEAHPDDLAILRAWSDSSDHDGTSD